MLDPKIRDDFPILSLEVNGKPLVYFDNAATSQKPQAVIDKLVEYYETSNANIHRGIHYLSEKATEGYEESKKKVARFINAKSYKEIIYTRNATESINLVAYTLGLSSLSKGDLVISTEMEHHSNIIPWQIIKKHKKIDVEFVPVRDDYTLDIDEYKKLLQRKPKLVTFVHASNVLGTINPAKEITRLAHKAGAFVLIDGAQSVPHMKIDVEDIDCDFLAFSSHKMCGPTGIGVLYGKQEILEELDPFMGGGDMINHVTYEESTWNKLPWKFEAGTPNIADAVAFGATVDYLEKIGMRDIEKHERELVSYALDKMKKVKGLEIFGQDDRVESRGGMVAFTLKYAHPHDVAQLLDEEGIAVRSGHHCAQPLHEKFKKSTTSRASFYLYNTKEEVDKMIAALDRVVELFHS
ncbi:cysteine desulfurase [Candidatus Dojkabacteria bacterium]|nr:cysteine desulfurase [Candidatus Dojkabacteria bacterium]